MTIKLNSNANLPFGIIFSRPAMKQILKSDKDLTEYSSELKKIENFKKGDEDEPHIVYGRSSVFGFDEFQLGIPQLYKVRPLGRHLPRLEEIKYVLLNTSLAHRTHKKLD